MKQNKRKPWVEAGVLDFHIKGMEPINMWSWEGDVMGVGVNHWTEVRKFPTQAPRSFQMEAEAGGEEDS